jgi:hypothetical protein
VIVTLVSTTPPEILTVAPATALPDAAVTVPEMLPVNGRRMKFAVVIAPGETVVICELPAKFAAETAIVTVPAGTLENVKLPSVAVIIEPPLYETVAPEIAAPTEFVTLPEIVPEIGINAKFCVTVLLVSTVTFCFALWYPGALTVMLTVPAGTFERA